MCYIVDILCVVDFKMDGIIFWVSAYFVSKKTLLSKVDISMSSFLWKRCNIFFIKSGLIGIFYKKGEIILREVLDVLSILELFIIFW